MVDILAQPYTVAMPAAKGVRLSDLPPEAWHTLSGAADLSDAAKLHRAVPWLFRGVDLRADAVADMPFVILRGETEVDSSRSWQNRIGFLPRPREILWLIEASLTIWGYCYLEQGRNVGRRLRELRYLLPTTVRPIIEPTGGLAGFERLVNGQTVRLAADDLVYFWDVDPFVEFGPPRSSPAQAALAAAGVLANIDAFGAAFFARGAIKGTLLTVKGNPPEQERERIRSWWQRLFSGVKDAWSTAVVNADAVTPVVVGEGLESLEKSDLTRSKREDIATALGIPHSLLMSNAANYATAQADRLSLYDVTVRPECSAIADVLNDQVFGPLGYRFQFQPESLDIYKANEEARSASLAALRSAGLPLLMAMDILGYELTEEQRASLERAEAERRAQAQTPLPTLAPGAEGSVMPASAEEELRTWRKWALRRVRQGKTMREFETSDIPAGLAGAISGALEDAATTTDVDLVFAGLWEGYP